MSKDRSRDRSFEVCKTETTVVMNHAATCSAPTPLAGSPIDDYYRHTAKLLQLSIHTDLKDDPAVMRLLLLGLVSAAEFYFRSVLAGMVEICPISRSEAAEQQLSLGAVDYYSRNELGYALIEGKSFSTKGEVRGQTNKLTGIEVPNNPEKFSVAAAIEAYETVCHLRHAAVHSRGELNARNAIELGLQDSGPRCLNPSSIDFQKHLSICHNAVRAYNRFLFDSALNRWISKGLLRGGWRDDAERFTRLYSLFVSRDDKIAPKNAYLAYLRVAPRIRKVVSVREGAAVQ